MHRDPVQDRNHTEGEGTACLDGRGHLTPTPQELDSTQMGFCEAPTNALRLLAPAGSGKTLSLLQRCVSLRKASAEAPCRFLVITFTRAARDELSERVQSSSEFKALDGCIDVLTLNKWGNRRLHRLKKNLQLKTRRRDRQDVILNNLQPLWKKHDKLREQLDFGHKRRAAEAVFDLIDRLKMLGFRHDKHRSLDDISQHIEWLRSAGMESSVAGLRTELHDQFLLEYSSPEEELQMMYQNFVLFWQDAIQRLFAESIVSFEDQKYWPLLEIEKLIMQGRMASKPHRYDAILVDEFQDINVLDLELLKSLSHYHQTDLTIVGDDDQAIFEWRGASAQFILNPDRFLGKPYKTHILTTNYRSPRNIVELSGKLIRNNVNRKPKEMIADSQGVAEIIVSQPPTLSSAMESVVSEVRELLEGGEVSNVALIGRLRSQLVPYQIAFAREGIPFHADMDLQVLLTRAFKDLKKMLAIVGRADGSSFSDDDPVEDLVFLCDKVGRSNLWGRKRSGLRRHLTRCRPRDIHDGVNALGDCEEWIGDAPKFQRAIRGLLEASSVSDKIKAIHAGFEGFRKDYFKSRDDVFYTEPPFDHLAEYAQVYGDDLGGFYRDVKEAAATLARLPKADDEAFPHWEFNVHLMTAHRAKGKEFDAVFILDANDGIWPLNEPDTEAQLEQERRLFYVAITRARKKLYTIASKSLGDTSVLPSRFLDEMELL